MPGFVREKITARDRRPYYPQLDGIRAIAAVMIMSFHFSQAFVPMRLLMLGQTGVDLFFVLSGFLISTILLKSQHARWGEIRNFYIRRSLRIFPLYFGYLLGASASGAVASWWFWIYLQNFPMAWCHSTLHGPNHFWSLAVEEQFYLVWPFLILFWPRRWLATAMWATIVFSTLLRVFLVHSQISLFYLTFTRLDGLSAGGLVALYLHRGDLSQARRYFLPLGGVSGLLLVLGAWMSHGQGIAWVQVIKFSAATGLYTSMVGWLLTHVGGVINTALASLPMRSIGRVSYGLYVYHPAILGLVSSQLAGTSLAVRFVAFVLLSYVIAMVSFYGFERRFTNLKQRLAPEIAFDFARQQPFSASRRRE
jgi:peptidoglycan/LPS O-acetylase OafA/YrhL